MKLTLERQIPLVFIIAIVLLAITGFFAYRSANDLGEAIRWERHTQEVLSLIEETLNSTLDAETAGRGYALTGSDAFLESYNQAGPTAGKSLAKLRQLIADNPQQRVKVAELEALIGRKLVFVNNVIETRRTLGINAAIAQVNTGQGKALMDEIRLAIGEMKATETALLKKREEDLAQSVANTLFVLFFGTTAGIVSLGLANFAIFREIGKRRAADEQLRVANRELENRVQARTKELSRANEDLKTEIEKREDAEEKRRIAVEAGALGIWKLNPATSEAEMDERTRALFGLSDADTGDLGAKALSRVHEEDFPTLEERFQKSVSEHANFRAEFRVRLPDGAVRWNYCTGQPVFGDDGAVKHIIGYCRDVTENKETEIALRDSEGFNRSIFESSPDCVKILELDGTLHSMNKNGLCIMEIDDFAEFAGKNWVDFWQDEESEAAFQAVETARGGKTGHFEGFCRTAKGTPRWWDVSVSPVFDAEGRPSRLISTSRDVTERREAERERERLLKNEQAARREAEIANRTRDEFLATVSHELRAPLNAILGWAKLLEKGTLDAKTTEKALETIVRNAEAQNRLIEDLLDVSRIISGKLRLEVTAVRPAKFVEAALETVRPAAEAKGITLEMTERANLSHISGDAHRLQQVVWNLLSNAIKFTPNGGTVGVEIDRAGGEIEIRVRDTGVGISPEFLPFVFDRFRQADASSIRKFGGLGLGLAIVRHLTEMHGGSVEVESAGENSGSTFIVRLPVVNRATENGDDEAAAVSTDGVPNLSLDGLLVLVVDDEEDTRQLLVQALTFYGATVAVAASAEEGLAALEAKNPDVLVSDIGMPDEDGYSLIRRVRALADRQRRETPAVALTAFTRAQDRMRSLAAGFQNHVSKPVELDELVTVIASLTGRLQPMDNGQRTTDNEQTRGN